MRRGWPMLGATVILFVLGLAGLTLQRPLLAPDEGRYAEIGHEMALSGDWIVPRLDGVPYLDKPPLLYWVEAAGLSLWGVDELGVHLGPILGAVAGLLLVARIGRELFDRETGAMAAALLASSGAYFGVSAVLLTDGLLTTSLCGAFLAYWRARSGRSSSLLVGVWLGLAYLAKGPVGPFLFVATLGLLWSLGDRFAWRGSRPFANAAILGAISLPWTIAMEVRVPGFVEYFFWNQNALALVQSGIHHARPWYDGPPLAAAALLPWSLTLPWVIRGLVRRRSETQGVDSSSLLLVAWAAVVIVLFTFSVSKLLTYYLPAMPPLAILIGRWLQGNDSRRPLVGAMLTVAIAMPAVGVLLSTHPLLAAEGTRLWPVLGVAAAGAFAAAEFARRGRVELAPFAWLAALAFSAIIAGQALAPIATLRSSRGLLLANASRIRACDPLLSDRSPVGLPGFYLGLRPWHVGTPGDFEAGVALTGDSRRFVPRSEVARLVRDHPRICVLAALRRYERGLWPVDAWRVVASDAGSVLLEPRDRRP